MLTYHRAAVALSGLPLAISPAAQARLAERERALGIVLPAAVREWYALDPPPGLMGLDGQDEPYGIDDLGKREGGHGQIPAHDPLEDGYLIIMYENQAVVRWAVHLTGADDPPVVVQYDWPGGPWLHHCDMFSTFIYTRIWDYPVQIGEVEEGCRVEGGLHEAADTASLSRLSSYYEARPHTYSWPTEVTYRFSHPGCEARIFVNIETGNNVDAVSPWAGHSYSYWYIWGHNAVDLETAVRDVWQFSGLAEALWDSNSPCGSAVLDRLRP